MKTREKQTKIPFSCSFNRFFLFGDSFFAFFALEVLEALEVAEVLEILRLLKFSRFLFFSYSPFSAETMAEREQE